MNKRLTALMLASLLTVTLAAGCSGSAKPSAKDASAPTDQNPHGEAPDIMQGNVPPAPKPSVTQYPLTIKDGAGRDVTIAAEPKRVISVAPAITEMVFAIGKGDVLVGRGDLDDYPEAVKQIPSVGGIVNLQFEKFVSLKPDLVLFTGGSEKVRDQLVNDYKLNVFVVDPKSFAGVTDAMITLGQVLNSQEKAYAAVSEIAKQAQEIIRKVSQSTERPKVFYQVWDDPLMTAGNDTYLGDLIMLAGGINVADDVNGWANYSLEQLQAKNPDIIITSTADGVAKVKAAKGWAGIRAVKEGKVFGVADPNLVSRPGPRLVQGLKWLAETLHPELFK